MKLDRKKLTEYRERRLLTVRELCGKASISLETWSRATNGGNLRVTTVRRLCEALEVSPEEIELKEDSGK